MSDNKRPALPFEENYQELMKRYDIIENSDTKLEDAIKAYEELLVYYNSCLEVLNKAKGRIEEIEVGDV
jgi:exodeoxyribonuclease VII small subunit